MMNPPIISNFLTKEFEGQKSVSLTVFVTSIVYHIALVLLFKTTFSSKDTYRPNNNNNNNNNNKYI